MNDKHSSEPWVLFKYPGIPFNKSKTIAILNAKGDVIPWTGFDDCGMSLKERRANARRIVACVNYCAGISTEVLEQTIKQVKL